MKECPQCHRTYQDETLNYCLDDGTELLYGPGQTDPQTAVLTSEAPTRTHTVEDGYKEKLPAVNSRRFDLRKAALLLLIPVIAVAGYFVYRNTTASSVKQIQTLAVLPISNDSADPDIEYLSDGLTESLISSLIQLPQLSVKARSSVFRYKGTDTDLKKIGRDLGVEALLTGRMVRRGTDLRVDVELVEAATEKVLWKADYHRSLSDLAALEGDLSRAISDQLRSKLTGGTDNRGVGLHTENAEAYENYLKGQYFRGDSQERINQSIDFYNKAIALDPNYAMAYIGLAEDYMSLGGVLGFASPRETFPKANQALKRALAINPDVAEAHSELAKYYLLYEWNWDAARTEFENGLRLDPNSSELHESFGTYLEARGKFDEAVREREIARKLDPMSSGTTADVGYPLYYARRQQEAIENFQKGADIDPNDPWPRLWIGQSQLEMKNIPEAIANIDKANELSGGKIIRIKATQGYAYAVAGRRDDALRIIDQLKQDSKTKYVSPFFFAGIYSGLGEKDEAFLYLDEAVAERHPYLILANVEPVFDNLRSDPRFAAVINRIGIPH